MKILTELKQKLKLFQVTTGMQIFVVEKYIETKVFVTA